MKVSKRLTVAFAAAATLTLAGCGSGSSSSNSGGDFNAANFFKGKTIRVIIQHAAGGGSDLYGRFIAARLGNEIPGHPRVTATNIEGLGAMSDIFSAKESNLVIGVSSQASEEYTTVLDPASKVDPSKVQVIGASGGDPRAFLLFTDAAKAYGDDLSKAEGSTSPTIKWAQVVGQPSDVVQDVYFSSWLCDTFKMPCKMVSVAGDDSTDMNLMVQRGELNAQPGTEITGVRAYQKQLVDGSAKAWSYAPDSNAEVTPPSGVTISDVEGIMNPAQKAEYEKIQPIISGGGLGKFYWAGPNVSKNVLDVLRTAYAKVLDDSSNLSQLEKIMAGGAGGGTSYKIKVLNGAEAQKAYDEHSSLFAQNLDYYKQVQSKYFNKYWK